MRRHLRDMALKSGGHLRQLRRGRRNGDASSGFFQFFGQLPGAAFADGEHHRAEVVELLRCDFRLLLLDDAHDVVHGDVGEIDADRAVYGAFDDSGRRDRFRRRFPVCGDQPRNPQFRAAEVADHDDQAVRQVVRKQLSQNRLPGRSRRFSVVVGPECGASRPQPPCVAMVRRVVVFLAQSVEDFAYLLLLLHGVGIGEELAAPLPRRRLGGRRNGQIAVLRFHPTAPL